MNTVVSRQHAVQTAMTAVWNRLRGEVFERLDLIAEVAAAYANGAPDESLRQQAEEAAHKLAGGLGTFGFAEGSRLARSLERMLALPRLSLDQARDFEHQLRSLRAELERPRPAGGTGA